MASETERLEAEITALTDKYNRTVAESYRQTIRCMEHRKRLLDKRLKLAMLNGDPREIAQACEEIRSFHEYKVAVDEIMEANRDEFPDFAPPALH
jgi:hypothetical protein